MCKPFSGWDIVINPDIFLPLELLVRLVPLPPITQCISLLFCCRYLLFVPVRYTILLSLLGMPTHAIIYLTGLLYSENSFDFLDYIPKIRSKIWISTTNKDFCGLSVAFYKRVSIIMLQKSSARKGFCAEESLAINRSSEAR